jgi:hypothetical protein
MRKLSSSFALCLTLLTPGLPFAAADCQTAPATEPAQTAPAKSAIIAKDYGKLPISFEANQGQANKSVKFLARGQGYGLYLTGQEAVLALHAFRSAKPLPGAASVGEGHPPSAGKTDVVRMQLRGANTTVQPTGVDALPGTANYFVGNDPSKWQTGVPTYSKVRFPAVYPGVDLVYYGNQSQLEYDFVVAPGADPKAIRLHFAGASKLALTKDGDLSVAAGNGHIAFHKPVVYQVKDGQHQPVEGRFTLLASHSVSFSLGSYDHSQPLVIDPVLVYATYLGGNGGLNSNGDQANAIAADSSGNAYIAGSTFSPDFPVTSGAFQTSSTHMGPFISKLDPTGSHLLFSTYLSGVVSSSAVDKANGIAVDGTGNVYVTGLAGSTDFPVTSGAFQTTNAAIQPYGANAFVTKLNPAGTALVYSTFLGGNGTLDGSQDGAQAIAVDSSGHAFVAGYAGSFNFPTTPGAFQRTKGGNSNYSSGSNAFIAEFSANGSGLVYSTFLGGAGGDGASALALDSQDDVYVTGLASSKDFPTTPGAYQTATTATNGGYNAFVTKLNPTGTGLLYSTYLGLTVVDSTVVVVDGQEIETGRDPWLYASGIAVDSTGEAYIVGSTTATDFPVTPGAFQPNNKAVYTDQPYNAFVSKLNATGSALIYSTYLGTGVRLDVE